MDLQEMIQLSIAIKNMQRQKEQFDFNKQNQEIQNKFEQERLGLVKEQSGREQSEFQRKQKIEDAKPEAYKIIGDALEAYTNSGGRNISPLEDAIRTTAKMVGADDPFVQKAFGVLKTHAEREQTFLERNVAVQTRSLTNAQDIKKAKELQDIETKGKISEFRQLTEEKEKIPSQKDTEVVINGKIHTFDSPEKAANFSLDVERLAQQKTSNEESLKLRKEELGLAKETKNAQTNLKVAMDSEQKNIANDSVVTAVNAYKEVIQPKQAELASLLSGVNGNIAMLPNDESKARAQILEKEIKDTKETLKRSFSSGKYKVAANNKYSQITMALEQMETPESKAKVRALANKGMGPLLDRFFAVGKPLPDTAMLMEIKAAIESLGGLPEDTMQALDKLIWEIK